MQDVPKGQEWVIDMINNIIIRGLYFYGWNKSEQPFYNVNEKV
jgi:hypothetical protein